MSLLLIFGAGNVVEQSNPIIFVPTVFQLDFTIAAAIRNGHIRFVQGFDITYNLNQRAILRCESIDGRDDVVNAYRPETGDDIMVALADGTPLFAGTIRNYREDPLEQPNKGVSIAIDAIDYSQIAEQTPIEGVFGSDALQIKSITPGNPSIVVMDKPHGFSVGATVTIEGTSGSSPSANGTFSVTIINPTTFSIPLNTTGNGIGGTARQRYYLRDILTVLFGGAMAEAGITLDPAMELGPLLEKVIFEGSLIDALDQLGAATGYVRRFLPSKMFQMFAAGTKAASFTLTKSNLLSGLSINKSRSNYANSIAFTYGQNVIVTKHHWFAADGVQKRFGPLDYKTQLGILGEEGKGPGFVYVYPVGGPADIGPYPTLAEGATPTNDETWFFNETTQEIVQRADMPTHPAGTIIKFVYAVQFPQKLPPVEDPSALVPGNRRVKRAHSDAIYEKAAAQQRAEVELALAMAQPRSVTAVTRAGLAFPGTTITVTHADRNIGGPEWLIQSTAIREDGDGFLRYTYALMEANAAQPGWIEFFKGLGGGGGSGMAMSSVGGVFTPGGTGGGSSIGPGTPGKLAKWTGFNAIGDSIITETAGALSVVGSLTTTGVIQGSRVQSNVFRGVAAAGNDLVIENAAGTAVGRVPSGGVNVILNGSLTVNNVITTPAAPATDLIVGASGNIQIAPGSKSIHPSVQHDVNCGRRDKKWLTVWADELWVETLVAQETIATIGGSIMVAPTTMLFEDLPAGATAIRVKHNNLFLYDTVWMKSAGQFEAMNIRSSAPIGGSAATGWVYPVIRSWDGSPANAWYAGDAVVNTGIPPGGDPSVPTRPQSGFLEIYSIRSVRSNQEYGPTIVGSVRTGYGAFETEPRWAIGNLRNLYNSGDVDRYGCAFGSYAKGVIFVTAEQGIVMMQNNITYVRIDTTGAYFTGVVTITGGNAARSDMSNVTTIDGGKITTGSIDASKIAVGSLSAITANVGNLTLNPGGYIISAGMGWGSGGPGVFLGWNGVGYAFAVGNWAGNRMYWDGAGNLIVVSNYIAFGNIVMDGGGITIPNGDASSGSRIRIGGATLYALTTNSLICSGHFSIFGAGYVNDDLYVGGELTCSTLELVGHMEWLNPDTTDAADWPIVWSSGNNDVYRKTNGYNGIHTFNNGAWIDFHRGIAINAGG